MYMIYAILASFLLSRGPQELITNDPSVGRNRSIDHIHGPVVPRPPPQELISNDPPVGRNHSKDHMNGPVVSRPPHTGVDL